MRRWRTLSLSYQYTRSLLVFFSLLVDFFLFHNTEIANTILCRQLHSIWVQNNMIYYFTEYWREPIVYKVDFLPSTIIGQFKWF